MENAQEPFNDQAPNAWDVFILLSNYLIFLVLPGFLLLDKYKTDRANGIYSAFWYSLLLFSAVAKLVSAIVIFVKYDYKNLDDENASEKFIDKSLIAGTIPGLWYFLKFKRNSAITKSMMKFDKLGYYKFARYCLPVLPVIFLVSCTVLLWMNIYWGLMGFEITVILWLFVQSLAIAKMIINNDVQSLEKYVTMLNMEIGYYYYIKYIVNNWENDPIKP